MDSITETCTKPPDCRDSVVIPVDGTEILIIDKKRKGWRRSLHCVAQVIQVADYKRLVHAIKFGLALVLVSLLYMLEAVHDKLGDNAMWAVMTVVVVFEFTQGVEVIGDWTSTHLLSACFLFRQILQNGNHGTEGLASTILGTNTIKQSAGSENGMKGSGVRIVIQVFLLIEILDKVELLPVLRSKETAAS